MSEVNPYQILMCQRSTEGGTKMDQTPIPTERLALRMHAPGDPPVLALETLPVPQLEPGEVLVRVGAAAITRDELTWLVDRLPAIPSYELSGVVVAVAPDVQTRTVGDAVFALTPFDRDGVATTYASVPAAALAPRPAALDDVRSAAVPMAGLSAWQGLFAIGELQPGERVLIHGAAGGVGHIATQLALWRGAHVIGTATGAGVEAVRALGAHEAIDRATSRFDDTVTPVDLVFDTVGGDTLARSPGILTKTGRLVSIAEEMPEGVAGSYFIVEPDHEQLLELGRLADAGVIAPVIDSVFPLADAEKAFERLMSPGKQGKVVLEVQG
jgi:NADPH:quinone reductase-like Zn-dependent oxidoreductase